MLAVNPLPCFNVLAEHFLPHATHLSLRPQESLTLEASDNKITLVRSGAVRIVRAADSALMGISSMPLIIGLPDMGAGSEYSRGLTALTPCELYQLSARAGEVILDRHQLWKAAFKWVSWQYRVLETRDLELVGQSTYKQIRASLLLMAEWDEVLRAKIGVIHFIQQRTHISRSVVAEVLSALRAGSYIEMSKGKLVSVNRLPLDY